MFYVSSIKGDKIGVTDTSDNIEEFYSDSQIVDIINKGKVKIYGTNYYNYKSNSKPIKINQSISEYDLKKLYENPNNPWCNRDIENYLASAKIGTEIVVDYVYVGDGDRRHHSAETRLKRIDYDNWYFEDTENTFSGRNGDSRFAQLALEVAIRGSIRLTKFKVYSK